MSYNKVILIGNAGKDPEVRHLESGVAVVTLPIATTDRVKTASGEWREVTEWHNVVFWRGLAETVEKYIKKGSQMFIEGKLRTRSWEDQSGQKKYATEVVAENLRLLGRRGDNNTQQNVQQESKPAISHNDIENSSDVDDLPF